MGKAYWIWYPGDFELYHGMVQNFSRMERGKSWPAFWKSEGFRSRVAFRRTYQLSEETAFTVYSNAIGHVCAGEKKYRLGEPIVCPAGECSINIHAACIEAMPAVYIEGDLVCSDTDWMVEDYERGCVKVGYSKYFTDRRQNPAVWDYAEREYRPVFEQEAFGGVLYEFETELTAALQVDFQSGGFRPITIYPGESKEEALDTECCYYHVTPDAASGRCERVAVRYAFIPDCGLGDIGLTAVHQYVDIPVRAKFECSDELLNRIWQVAQHTFQLCSGIFFIDGVKRDKWIWSGDAYQSLFVNEYLFADPDINRRTLRALGGNMPARTHINTILDYSLLWIIGIGEHVRAYHDTEFLRQIYPLMESYMRLFEEQLDGNGFLIGRPQDWIYIDWAEMDKTGALCAEQMLYLKSLMTMAELGERIDRCSDCYMEQYHDLRQKVDAHFWDEEKCAYIDSFESGRRNVTRHANIFAILFDIAKEERKRQLVHSVLFNSGVAQITTPYFKFFEMDALCKMGYVDTVMEQIKSYWGGMLERGAVTFWEEFDPEQPEETQYDMYGDHFGKSLCHAWAASPIYLIARYVVGFRVTNPASGEYEVAPNAKKLAAIRCTFPAGDKDIPLTLSNGTLAEPAGQMKERMG